MTSQNTVYRWQLSYFEGEFRPDNEDEQEEDDEDEVEIDEECPKKPTASDVRHALMF